MFDLKKLLEAGFAQVNPFDDGKDWNSVYNEKPAAQPSRPQPAQTPAPQRQQVRQPAQTRTTPTPQRYGDWIQQAPQVNRPQVRIEKPKVELPKEKNFFEKGMEGLNKGIADIPMIAEEVGKATGQVATSIAQGAARVPETVFRSTLLEPLVGNAGKSPDKAISTASDANTGIREFLYGKSPVQSYQEQARDIQSSLKRSDNKLVQGASDYAPFISPALAALDLTGVAKAGFPLTKKVYESGSQVLRNSPERMLASKPAEYFFGDKAPVQNAIQSATPTAPAVTPAPTAPVELPKVNGPASRQRGFTSSVQASTEVSPDVRRNITPDRYVIRNTQQLADEADTFARQPIKKVQTDVNERLAADLGKIDDRTIADSIAVAKRLDESGDFDGANQIYERLAEHGTKGGQAIQAFSLLSNRTPEGMQFYAARTLKKNGVDLAKDKAKQAQLKELIDQVKQTEAGSEARKMATYQVAQFVNSQTPTGVADKAVNLWRAGLLTAPTTTAGNILGNATEAATRNLFVNPVATGADVLMSLFTGQRSKTMAGGNLDGAREGMDKLGTFLKNGYDERNVLDKFDVHQTNYGDSKLGKAAQGYTDSVYRMMGAADQPFYYAAKNQALKDLAGAEAINRGLKGADRDAFIREFMDNPTPEALDRAAASADQATYRDKTILGEGIKGAKQFVRRKSETAGAVTDFIVPFTQVPASIASRIITRTPIGTATEIVKQIKSGKFDQRAMAEAIGNGTFGPTMMGAGFALANSGQMTFGYPDDPKEQELWRLEGKQPYSIKVDDRWYSLNYMQPFGTLIAMGGNIKDAVDRGEDPTSVISESLATAGQSVMNQSFLKGVSGILDAIDDPKRYAENFWENTAGSVVPNFIRSGTRSADPVQRDTGSALDGLAAGIPGLRQTLPEKTDAFGRPLPAKDTFLNQFVNPLKPSIARGDDSVVNELRRLQDEDSGIMPSGVAKNSLGKGTVLTDEQMRGIKESVGPELYNAWEQVMSDPRYAAMSNEDKVKILDRTKDTVGGAMKTKFGAENGIIDTKTAADKLTTKQANYLKDGSSDFIEAASTKASKTYADKYETAKKAWDDNADKWSEVEKITKAKELTRLEVQKDYDEDIIDLYQMSKADAFAFIQKAPNGQELADKLVAYGDALVGKGVNAYSKYRNKNGVVSVAPATKKSSGGKKSGGGRKRATFKPPKSAQDTTTIKKIADLRRNTKLTARRNS